ncbi:unannotated protein [freshwater metagenome]|uniref:Unannotated protein n=1 Tax=freshwater metagenome TaxID=449393 RepID=A0A6J6RJT1_9ZZZZ
MAGANTYKYASGTCAHEMQRCLIGGAATDDHGDVDFTNELLEIERFCGLRHMLGRNNSALNDE